MYVGFVWVVFLSFLPTLVCYELHIAIYMYMYMQQTFRFRHESEEAVIKTNHKIPDI